VAQKGIFTGGLRHYCSMSKPVDLILGMMAAMATAVLMGLIARDDIGMPPGMVREDALIAASVRRPTSFGTWWPSWQC
jgi:hypothetical protein